jgi:hypothetical protein
MPVMTMQRSDKALPTASASLVRRSLHCVVMYLKWSAP